MLAALDPTDLLFIAALMIVCNAVFAMFRPTDAARLARVERKLDAVIKHMHITIPEAGAELSDEVRRLADAGQKIQAIAQYRRDTGAGLADAKDAVEAYQARA